MSRKIFQFFHISHDTSATMNNAANIELGRHRGEADYGGNIVILCRSHLERAPQRILHFYTWPRSEYEVEIVVCKLKANIQ